MSTGERIKSARVRTGLSLRALAQEVGVSAQAISKYERDLDVPSSPVLLKLAKALKVKNEYFFRPSTVSLSTPIYRSRAPFSTAESVAILGDIQEWLERYLEVECFVESTPPAVQPVLFKRSVPSLNEVDRVAEELRDLWQLGQGPIENMIEVVEDKGIKVGMIDGWEQFDGVTVWANETTPVIVVNREPPGDRQRFNVAHELGHLVMDPADNVDAEKAAHRFAGAFLVPAVAARFELGEKRRTLSLLELHMLKHKYGLSMQGWIHRAKDLNIISEAAFSRLLGQFHEQNWRRVEPGDQLPPEEPSRMERLVVRALVEDIISETRAAELLGKPLKQFWQEQTSQHGGLPVGVGH